MLDLQYPLFQEPNRAKQQQENNFKKNEELYPYYKIFVSVYIEFKICPLNITLLQKTKNVKNFQTDVFLIASNQYNIMITTEKVL